VVEQRLSDFCGSVSARVAKYTNYEVAFDYWDDETDVVVSDVVFEQPRSFRYVPVPLRETLRSTIAVPFRRRLDLPWHVMIALRQRAICPKLLRQISASMVDQAVALGASRVEIAHVQYYGWAIVNRAKLMPTREQVARAAGCVEALRKRYHGSIVIDVALPDYFARYPKPCMGGWGRRSLNVSPSGKVLPCHAAETIPGLEFWSVRDHSLADIWHSSPSFNAFRGTDWMKEPCASCPRRLEDFGGCRCQALALTGDAREADPVCHLSPHHGFVAKLAEQRDDGPFIYRRQRTDRTAAAEMARVD
jgi:coenzyme PQQ biosynthesis enzyme PqqE